VITDADGGIIAEGRNRAYDPPGGDGILQGSPLAHAELNALAEIPTGRGLDDCVLWSSQQPCSMCRAAAEFVEVGEVRYLGVDPAFVGTDRSTTGAPLDQTVAVAPEWPLVANALFLASIIAKRGDQAEAVVRNRELEPETVELASAVVDQRAVADSADLDQLLAPLWNGFVAAAIQRTTRTKNR
jgi:tRNA(Arg) A34 adenosine deaminase TadA